MDNINYLLSLKERLMNYKRDLSGDFVDLAFGDILSYSSSKQHLFKAQLVDALEYVQKTSRREIEREFLVGYWGLAGQSRAVGLNTSMACYSASTAIEITANYLKKFHLRTALIEPTFDNLPSILQRVGVDLVSLQEDDIFPSIKFDKLFALELDAVFLVLPNNPTGRFLDKVAFNEIVAFCAEHKILLVVDFCFRFFSEAMSWDQYGMALDADCSFLFIEDTGKTWSLLDLKTALITAHPRIFTEIKRIHNEFLLNVSPFVLELIHQFIVSAQNSVEFEIVNVAQERRKYLRDRLAGTLLQPVNLNSRISFEWLQIVSEHDDLSIWELLKTVGVYTLPGSLFYWKTPLMGAKKMRIALMRNQDEFVYGVDKIVTALKTLNHP
jgi:aspartate/methionine/tyrosine aminotransferase